MAVQLHIEAMQTAIPTRSVEPGRSRRVAVSPWPLAAEAAQRRFRVVFYYRDAAAIDAAAWTVPARLKESLSEALGEHPEMAGRLRRREGWWEVKYTDTGVRLLHASVEMAMAEFLEAEDREAKEAALALWTDVDVEDPDSCPPCFVQVTRFQGDGYALGISCSLLLPDPLSLVRFLQSWARTHTQMLANGALAAHPMTQYLNYLERPGHGRRVKSLPLASVAAAAEAATVLFRAAGARPEDEPSRRALAAACIARATAELRRGGGEKEEPAQVSVLADDSAGVRRIESWAAGGGGGGENGGAGHALRVAHWRETGIEELVLGEGGDGKPVRVSYSIVPCGREGLVVVMRGDAGDGEFLVSATVPVPKETEEVC